MFFPVTIAGILGNGGQSLTMGYVNCLKDFVFLDPARFPVIAEKILNGLNTTTEAQKGLPCLLALAKTIIPAIFSLNYNIARPSCCDKDGKLITEGFKIEDMLNDWRENPYKLKILASLPNLLDAVIPALNYNDRFAVVHFLFYFILLFTIFIVCCQQNQGFADN